jgi:aminoacrylate hydrolase
VGHSLGGNIAATIAARFPRTTASLTLVGMVPVPPSAATVHKLTRLFGGESSNPETDLAAGEELIGAWFRGGTQPQGDDRETFLAAFRRHPAVVRQSLLAGVTGAAPEVADLVSVPTLVLTGTRDATRPPAAVADFLARHPDWRHTSVQDAGHMVQWEQPAACADAILRHVESAEHSTGRLGQGTLAP